MSTILVRGEDNNGNFRYDSPPMGDMDNDAIKAHAQSMAPHAPTKYATA